MYDKSQIQLAEQICNENLPKIFALFNVSLEKYGNAYYGTCCCHNSDKPNSMAIYLNDGHLQWACFTKKCQKTFVGNSLGLVRGLLSRKNGYSGHGDPIVSFNDTIKWVLTNLNGSLPAPSFSPSKQNQTSIDNEPLGELQLTRAQVRQRLNLPSPYMLSRGFCPHVLNEYDIGESISYNPKTCWRAIVPIYDPDGKLCIGVTARSVFPVCPNCACYHDSKWPCPKESMRRMYSKWKNVSFKRRYSLYNYWKLPEKCQSLVIVESPGNVWKLVEAGIKNVVAIYGSYLINSFQEKLIAQKGVKDIYLGFDNDISGETAFQQNGQKLWERYNVHALKPTESDFAEMKVEVIKEKIWPQIKGNK